jgi:hypothetical protein
MTTHGERSGGKATPETTNYYKMIGRCYNPNFKQFQDYGGRGISVCDEWRGENGYANFVAYLGRRPTPKHTVDRIDVNGNYEPGNVRWATPREQALNKRLHKRNKTGIAGVWFDKTSEKWSAMITVMYKQIHLLRTQDFFEACCARKSAELKYGEIK